MYIPEITGMIPENLCAYVDFGFSLVTKDLEKTTSMVQNADINKISDILKKNKEKYSISRVGYSISITIGSAELTRGNEQILTNAGLINFMEILPDGSFRCRVIITSEVDSSIANISSITLIPLIFSDIYKSIFGDLLCKCFIEAHKYEKLTVLKLFQPKLIVKSNDKYEKSFNEYYNNHLIKYGNNIVVNSNRIPMTGFLTLDKKLFEINKVKFSSDSLYFHLFNTQYNLLGYVDDYKMIENDKNDIN